MHFRHFLSLNRQVLIILLIYFLIMRYFYRFIDSVDRRLTLVHCNGENYRVCSGEGRFEN